MPSYFITLLLVAVFSVGSFGHSKHIQGFSQQTMKTDDSTALKTHLIHDILNSTFNYNTVIFITYNFVIMISLL